MGIYPAMRNPDKTFETLLYENFDGTVTHTSCSPGMDPKTYPADTGHKALCPVSLARSPGILGVTVESGHTRVKVVRAYY